MAYGGKEVSELILERLPRTLLMALLAHVISSVVGIGIGIYVAPRQYSLADNLAALVAFFMTSVPRFALALIMMYWLVFGLGQQHVSSFFSPQYALAPWSWAKLVDFTSISGRWCSLPAWAAWQPTCASCAATCWTCSMPSM